MKRLLFAFCSLMAFTSLQAQNIDPQYQDGVLYFRLTSDFPMNTLRFDDNDVLRTSELPMLSDVFEKYGVNLLLRPFHLFGNEIITGSQSQRIGEHDHRRCPEQTAPESIVPFPMLQIMPMQIEIGQRDE